MGSEMCIRDSSGYGGVEIKRRAKPKKRVDTQQAIQRICIGSRSLRPSLKAVAAVDQRQTVVNANTVARFSFSSFILLNTLYLA